MNLILALLIAAIAPTAYPAREIAREAKKDEIVFMVNNRKVNCVAPPVVTNGRLLLSARDVGDSFGKEINWNPDERSITIKWSGKTFKSFVGVKEIEVNGVKKSIDAPPAIINGYTMLPARVIVEELGGKLTWRDDTKTASATYHFNGAAIFSDYYDEQIAKEFTKKHESGTGSEKIVFWSDEVLKDFRINAADYLNPSISKTEYYKEELELNEALIYNLTVPEGVPTHTVSYNNSKGVKESYWISYNGITGGVALTKAN